MSTSPQPLITKYRPITWDEVIGNTQVVNALRDAVNSETRPHAYLLTGSSGVGKTTLARIIASSVNADIEDMCAATNSSVDDTRRVVEISGYRPLSGKPKLIIIDECFAPWTEIATPEGSTEIEHISVGSLVCNAVGSGKVKAKYQKLVKVENVIELTLTTGKVILTTKEHPFLTTKGWVVAEKLTKEDQILAKGENKRYTLSPSMLSMWDKIYDFSNRNSTLLHRMQSPQKNKNLCYLQKQLSSKVPSYQWSSDLFRTLPFNLSEPKIRWEASLDTKPNRSLYSWSKKIEKRKARFLQTDCFELFRTNEEQQSSFKRRNKRKDIKSNAGEDISCTRWEWKANRTSITASKPNWIGTRISNRNFGSNRLSITSQMLQSRSSISESQVSSRGRWRLPQYKTPEVDRQEKNSNLGIFGLESITSIKQGGDFLTRRNCKIYNVDNTDYVLFYDLEVENHHSYIAEGVVVHNCHNLSEKAWEPLLKLSEEPPSYLYIAFCTTNERKVPKTIKTRAYPVSLKEVHPLELEDLIVTISELEGWTLENDVRTAIVQASEGSPRKALSILQAGHGCKTRDELSQIITEVESESGPVDELCRELVKGNRNFKRITQLVAKIDNYDEAIDQICSYLAVSLLRSEEKQAQEIWRMLAAFTHSRTGYNGKVNIATAIGTILWGNMVF